jgi:hypothetical protein
MDTKQTFCNDLNLITGVLTVIILVSELLPFLKCEHNGIAHMLYKMLTKKRNQSQEIEMVENRTEQLP